MVIDNCRLLVIAAWLLPLTAWAAPAPCQLTVDAGQSQYGKPVLLQLTLPAGQFDSDTLDLTALDRDFVIESNIIARAQRAGADHSLRLRLYARRPGALQVPALRCGTGTTRPMTVAMAPARDDKDHSLIQVTSTISESAVWIKQPVQVTMHITGAFRYAGFDTEPATTPGLEVEMQSPVRSTVRRDGRELTQHQSVWRLYALRSGAMPVQLPALKYRRGGTVTHWFYPPRVDLRVRALPAYVPVTLPIGRIAVQVALPAAPFLLTGHLNFLRIDITGAGARAHELQELTRQLHTHGDLQFYPHRLVSAALPDVESRDVAAQHAAPQDGGSQDAEPMASAARSRISAAGHVLIEQPFTPGTMGLLALPALRVQYFDPDTGKIVTYRQALGTVLVLAPWAVYPGAILALIVAGLALRRGYGVAARRVRVWQIYGQALARLREAQTPAQLTAALLDTARAEAWPENLTLHMWLCRWQRHYPCSPHLETALVALQAQLYGGADVSLADIRGVLLHACHQRLPLLKFTGKP